MSVSEQPISGNGSNGTAEQNGGNGRQNGNGGTDTERICKDGN